MDDQTPAQTPIRPRIVEAPNRTLSYAATDSRQRKTGWSRFALATRRWARDTFSRESLASSIKSLMWVAPLTVLIWIYAEREQVAKMTLPPFEVEVKSADPRKVVTVLNLPEGTMTADLSGPQARLEAVRDALDPRTNPPKVRIEVRSDLAVGRHQIDAAAVADDSRFNRGGVTVTNTTPRVLNITVEQLGAREVNVEVPPEARDRLSQPALFQPAKVQVTAPEEVLEQAAKDDQLAAYVELDKLLATPGVHSNVPVRVRVPFGDKPHVTVSPSTVVATVTVNSNVEARETFRGVPVWPTGAGSILNEYKVVFREGGREVELMTLPTLTVIGPQDQIDLMKAPKSTFAPVAIVPVARDDESAEFKRRQISTYIGLPDGVRVAPEDLKKQVELRLVDKSAEP